MANGERRKAHGPLGLLTLLPYWAYLGGNKQRDGETADASSSTSVDLSGVSGLRPFLHCQSTVQKFLGGWGGLHKRGHGKGAWARSPGGRSTTVCISTQGLHIYQWSYVPIHLRSDFASYTRILYSYGHLFMGFLRFYRCKKLKERKVLKSRQKKMVRLNLSRDFIVDKIGMISFKL